GIFCAFHRVRNRSAPACNQRLHCPSRHAESRRTLGSIQNCKSSARTRAHINQSSALAQTFHNRVHSSCNFRNLASHGHRDLLVFVVHQLDHLQRFHPVQIS